jgi:xanthine dehydrogenase FAD-binding subunit
MTERPTTEASARKVFDMYVRPRSVEEACQWLASERFTIVAGATDIFGTTTADRVDGLLDISRIDRLRQVETDASDIRIGAAVTWSQLRDAALPGFMAGLQQASATVGSRQIQNRGTIGGNICHGSAAADGVPPLLALDATVEIASNRGHRQVALQHFLHEAPDLRLARDELLEAVRIPIRRNATSAFLKFGRRNDVTIAVVSAAATIDWSQDGIAEVVHISVGAASRVPVRLHGLERRLAGMDYRSFEPPVGDADVSGLSPISDIRAGAQYRRHAAQVLVRRSLQKAAEEYAHEHDRQRQSRD